MLVASHRRIFPSFLLISMVRDIPLASALSSHWVEDFADGTPKAERMQRHSILVRHLQQANQLLLRVNILHLWLGLADKNKPQTLSRQPNSALNARNV
jgi:hypothetical protein